MIVAEIGANHNGSLARAFRLIDAAKDAGADAVKLQAYTADTLTLDCDGPGFTVTAGPWFAAVAAVDVDRARGQAADRARHAVDTGYGRGNELMPWQASDAHSQKKAAKTAKDKNMWAHVANSVLQRTGNDGLAVREANAVLRRALLGRERKKRKTLAGG